MRHDPEYDGPPFVGGELVAEAERGILREAGLSALRRLHAAGVLHGDMDCRNLRVKPEEDEMRRVQWR